MILWAARVENYYYLCLFPPHYLRGKRYSSCAQQGAAGDKEYFKTVVLKVLPKSAGSACGNLLEIQILEPHPKLTESKTGVRPTTVHFNKPPG